MAATKLLHLVALLLSLLLASLHSQMALSQSSFLEEAEEDEEEEEYVLDSPFSNTHLRSRFLASVKKGKSCNADKKHKNVCNVVYANKGTSLIYCCKKHCRDVLGDQNNCGRCGNRCPGNLKCCGGRCINVLNDPKNCGKCGKQCKKGKRCGFGMCGYA